MDPKLTEQLQQTLAALLANAQDASAWAKGQVPLLVQEKILFGRINETVQFLLCLGVFVACVVVARRCISALQDDPSDEIGYAIGIAASSLAGCALMFAGAVQCQMMLMAWFAPRLYIVEWLMAQVHK